MKTSAVNNLNAETAYLFRHGLLRDAAYSLQLPGNRGELHVLVADILESIHSNAKDGEWTAEVASHLAEAARATSAPIGARILEFASRAGQWSEDHARFDVSQRMWQLVVEFGQGIQRCRGLRGVAVSLLRQGDAITAEANIRLALSGDVRPPTSELIPLYLALGSALEIQGKYEDAEQIIKEGLQLAMTQGESLLAARLMGNQAILYGQTGRLGECLESHRTALEMFRSRGDSRSETLERANYGSALVSSNQFADAERELNRATQEAEATGQSAVSAACHNSLARMHILAGRAHAAATHSRLAIDAAQSCGHLRMVLVSLSVMASEHANAGRLAEAESLFKEVVDRAQEGGATRYAANSRANLAVVYLRSGRHDEAAGMLHKLLFENQALLEESERLYFLSQYALACHALGQADKAKSIWRTSSPKIVTAYGPALMEKLNAEMEKFCLGLGLDPL